MEENDNGNPAEVSMMAPLSPLEDISIAGTLMRSMLVHIRNARIYGYTDLVHITCDTATGRIASIFSEPSPDTITVSSSLPRSSRHSSALSSRITLERQEDGDVSSIDANGSLVLPGLVHGHIHLDKPYLLDRCSIEDGTFGEAMRKTQQAKVKFDEEDLLARGRRLIRTSISHGVTTMRAHVEVDPAVCLSCLDVGLQLRAEFRASCDIRLVVFAQDSIFTTSDQGVDQQYTELMQSLLEAALNRGRGAISAIGSAPYVEKGGKQYERANIAYILDLAQKHGIDADFHLDFDLSRAPRLLELIEEVRKRPAFHSRASSPGRRDSFFPLQVTLGHCRTLSRIDPIHIYTDVARAAEGLELFIVGLPNSDMYMKHANEPLHYRDSPRSILNALDLERQSTNYLRGRISLSVNNVGNLFTPQGDGDPLALLPLCVAVYQDATEKALASLLRMVTVQAGSAAGLRFPERAADLTLQSGEPADLVILDGCTDWRTAALSPPFGRVTLKGGKVVGKRSVQSWIQGDLE